MQKLQPGYVCTVSSPRRLNWATYSPSSSDVTYAPKPLPETLQRTLADAFRTGLVPPDIDLATLRKQLSSGDWVCHVCCDELAAARAMTVRVPENRKVTSPTPRGPGQQSSNGQAELRLRRHVNSKHAVLNDAGGIEWKPGPAPHTSDCPEIKGKTIVLRSNKQSRSAPEVRKGNPADWSYTFRAASDASDVSAGRRDYGRLSAHPDANPLLLHPARSQLMTLLTLAGLLTNVTRRTVMAAEWRALLAAVHGLDGGQTLSPSTPAIGTYLVGSSKPICDGADLCSALGAVWAIDGTPIVTAIVLLVSVEKLAGGGHLATTLGQDGRRGKIELPPSVKFWAGNVTPARAPFLCLFRMIIDETGQPLVLFGYAHPVLSVDCFCPVESDVERNTAAHRLNRWFYELPEAQRKLVTIEKIEFTECFGERNLMFDFLIRISLSRSRTVRFLVEQLGSIDPAYVASKIKAKSQVEATTGEHIIYVGSRSEREAIDPRLLGLEEQLMPIERLLQSEAARLG